jgi:sugar lactone lactonase YvrE
MSDITSKLSLKYSVRKRILFCFPVLALILCGSNAGAATAPAVVIDTQKILANGFNNPQAIAVNATNQGAIFIADTNNNQLVVVGNGYSFAFQPTGFTLNAPSSIALDAKGDLFVGDSPSNNGTNSGRIIEMPADNTGNLTGAAQLVYSGGPLVNPVSLTVDSAGTLFIGDYPFSTGIGAIYSLAAGSTTLRPLNFTGLNSPFTPAALLRDSSNNLYIADNGNYNGSNGGVYIAPDTGGAAQQVATQSFVINQPSGLVLDSAGDLFILSLLGSGTGYNAGQQVVVVPGASPANPYILPNNGIGTSSSMALDGNGNLDVLDSGDGEIFQLNFANPTYLGNINVGQAGTPIQFNFEFNAPTTLNGFRIVSQGDVSTDVTAATGGNCTTGKHTNLPNGGPAISPFYPYTCLGNYQGSPVYPGLRNSSILVRGASATIIGSTNLYELGNAAAEITYPLNATTTASGLQQPQGLAISGLNKTVYIADTQAGVVYSTSNLGGSTLTPVSTGTIALQAPSAVALDGAGNLFVADFNLGEVIKVPTYAGGPAPSVVIAPGGLLQHPIALTVDYLGNLFVGDAGPGGVNAGTGNPGYVVKLAAGATIPVKLPMPPAVPLVFPQSLTTDPYTGYLFIGDGGDASGVGQVYVVTIDGSLGGPVALNNVTNPTGLSFDPAGSLYVLDGTANTITVDQIFDGSPQYLVNFDNSSLAAASAMAMSAGGQSFVIANIGSGSSNSLVYLNGNRSTLAFGGVKVGQSSTLAATEYNIGNLPLTLASPYYTTNGPNNAFSLSNSSTCGNNLTLQVGGSCSMDVVFTPVTSGQTTQQIMVDSNAYNSGTPILTVRGTGK